MAREEELGGQEYDGDRSVQERYARGRSGSSFEYESICIE